MSDNIIDARSMFLGKRLLDTLEKSIESHKDRYLSFYLTFENEGQEWLELCLKDLTDNSIIVVDSKPIHTYDADNFELFR